MKAQRGVSRTCPMCGDELRVTRLGCPGCGTELRGSFDSCEFCSVSQEDREILRVFLVSHGNIKELERRLGVSYPTARARLDAVLGRMDLGGSDSMRETVDVLERLASGSIDIDEAERRLT